MQIVQIINTVQLQYKIRLTDLWTSRLDLKGKPLTADRVYSAVVHNKIIMNQKDIEIFKTKQGVL